jgi:polyphosphate kinase
MPHEAFLNRELSWLAFNERVLAQAEKVDLPLLERVKFLAISASNLDEFFMVRVGGLRVMKAQGRRERDESGLTPHQQLIAIRSRLVTFVERQYRLLREELAPKLAQAGIRRILPNEASPGQRAFLRDYFLECIHPILSPVAIDDDAPFLTIPALQLAVICSIRSAASAASSQRHVVIFLPSLLPRHIPVADTEGTLHSYMNLEDVVTMFLGVFFPQEIVVSHAVFRISRNTDIAVEDEADTDLAESMGEILDARKMSDTIRLEVSEPIPRNLVTLLQQLCQATIDMTYRIPGELDLRAYFAIASLPSFDDLKLPSWPPRVSPRVPNSENIFDSIAKGDILLYHPYQSFDPVLSFIESAADDPHVVAIKQVLYRTAKNSRIISALIRAAEAGKSVTVLVELKARFDEARNLERAHELIRAGAQIIYGVRGLKTHAKICLVVRREGGRLRRYVHFGTGNYNEATAHLYTDISLLTCSPDYGMDASGFFNAVTGLSQPVTYQKLSMAPFSLRHKLMEMIHGETERARQGGQAEIWLKMNSLQDPTMIRALYEASQAGVMIKANVRGVCCLRPGVKGLSDNIEVVSIIDRYLEHARIYYFHQGGSPRVFFSSADWMLRNLDKRVELLVPVDDPVCKREIVQILKRHFEDNMQSWKLMASGEWQPVIAKPGKAMQAQAWFAKWAGKQEPGAESLQMLVPHIPHT